MAEGSCKSCDILTKYRCLKCNAFACNSSLDCSVFASESFPGWTAGSRAALCKECNDLETLKENDEKENATDVGNHEDGDCQRQEDSFVFDSASRGFHEYRRFWAPRMRHRFSVFFEMSSVLYPYFFIPITLEVFKGDTPDNVLKKMGENFERFYVEPGKIPPTESLASDDEGEVL